MDVNDMRVAVMLLGLVLFLGIWAWSLEFAAPRRLRRGGAPALPRR